MQNRTFITLDSGVIIRSLSESDSISHITKLLHRSYKRLLDMGLNFVATNQTDDETRDRLQTGESYVAELNGEIVGTLSLYHPESNECEWYSKANVMHFGQFAVEPKLQGTGIGKALITLAIKRATELGATELALDTSEKATHLIEMYESMGFRLVETVQWDRVNYRSVILSKPLNNFND